MSGRARKAGTASNSAVGTRMIEALVEKPLVQFSQPLLARLIEGINQTFFAANSLKARFLVVPFDIFRKVPRLSSLSPRAPAMSTGAILCNSIGRFLRPQ